MCLCNSVLCNAKVAITLYALMILNEPSQLAEVINAAGVYWEGLSFVSQQWHRLT